MTRQEYVRQFGPVAQRVTRGTGLYASVMIAQGIIETSRKDATGGYSPDETNPLFVVHNHFGIKDQPNDEWTLRNIVVRTWEWLKGKRVNIDAKFRAYDSVEAGFRDYVQFLRKNPRYVRAGVFGSRTPQEQADRLQQAGYATDPLYAAKIKSIINTLKLHVYDA